jgi:hypothetical protein
MLTATENPICFNGPGRETGEVKSCSFPIRNRLKAKKVKFFEKNRPPSSGNH